ncbi:hypothetical protein OESDEN_07011 [Oesophagostomum dentatum]|uniref:Uncharacterized protein n=1 Tax=Oesophagostomum dentatum TaxID=61180 RepID=A0A0B1T697_OESDE|nr:hypothetical protein OESDEN_07011 [Oesophagostomum dentatum]
MNKVMRTYANQNENLLVPNPLAVHTNHNQAPLYTPTMTFSKVQLLNNQHLEPVYEEASEEKQLDPVIVDCSARECNEWSIYTVPLPTQLHVKCHCFPPKT